MTLESFRTRVMCHAMLMAFEGLEHDLEAVIYWDSEWHHKYADALKGRYDA